MKFYFTIIIFILITCPYSFAQNNYNLNIKFRVIEKFDKILSSDNKEYVFYIDANYIFTDEGKTIYSNNIYNIQNTLNEYQTKADNLADFIAKQHSKLNFVGLGSAFKTITKEKNADVLIVDTARKIA